MLKRIDTERLWKPSILIQLHDHIMIFMFGMMHAGDFVSNKKYFPSFLHLFIKFNIMRVECREGDLTKKPKSLLGFSPLLGTKPLHGRDYTPGASTSSGQSTDLERKCDELQRQITQMKAAFTAAGLQRYMDEMNPVEEADLG